MPVQNGLFHAWNNVRTHAGMCYQIVPENPLRDGSFGIFRHLKTDPALRLQGVRNQRDFPFLMHRLHSFQTHPSMTSFSAGYSPQR